MKAIQIRNYIKGTSKLNRTGLLSAFAIFLLALACLYPLSKSEQTTEAVTGTAQSSSLTLDVTSASASVDLQVNSSNGTFAASTDANSAKFSVTTNNFSGYTLSISGNDGSGLLYNDDKSNSLSSITSAISESTFSATNSTTYNNMWGYKPSKLNSQANTNYLPAPTTEASTLDVTPAANNTANNYTISLGARTDYTKPSATYSNTFIITAVPNAIAYQITYDPNTTDTVTSMPQTQASSTSATSITLSNTTPVRDGYDFLGWCSTQPTEANPETCSGQTFQPGGTFGIDKTISNVTTLYAIWKAQGPTVTYDANGGYFNGNTSQTTNAVRYTVATETVTKYSHTSNVDDAGNSTSSTYPNNSAANDIITIPGATELHITLDIQTESTNYDWLAIYDGSVTPSASNYGSSITGGKLGGTTKQTGLTYTVPGDTAQFFFRTDSSGNSYYGYYAVITAEAEVATPATEVISPTRLGYTFFGWYTDIAGTTPFTPSGTMESQIVYAKWAKNQIPIVFNGNGNTGGSMSSQNVTWQGSTTLTANNFTRTNYAFIGWNTNANGTGTWYDNEDIYNYTSAVSGDTLTLYAQWGTYVGDIQDYTKSQCSTGAASAPVYATDARDDKVYSLRYINGNCWMTQNLAYDFTASTQFSTSTSNVTSNYTLTSKNIAVGDLTSGNTLTEARIHKPTSKDMETINSGSTKYRKSQIGYWYNYCAASAGEICTSSNSVEATMSICPAGWRLPTGNTSGEQGGIRSNVTEFSPVYGGYWYSGSLNIATTYGLWWSSTVYGTTSRYRLRYDGGSLSTSFISRDGGLYVRCVRAS